MMKTSSWQRTALTAAGLVLTAVTLAACGGSSSSSGSGNEGNVSAAAVGNYSGTVEECGNTLDSVGCTNVSLNMSIASDGRIEVTLRDRRYPGFMDGKTYNVFSGDPIEAFRAVGNANGVRAKGSYEFSRKRRENGVPSIDQYTAQFNLKRSG